MPSFKNPPVETLRSLRRRGHKFAHPASAFSSEYKRTWPLRVATPIIQSWAREAFKCWISCHHCDEVSTPVWRLAFKVQEPSVTSAGSYTQSKKATGAMVDRNWKDKKVSIRPELLYLITPRPMTHAFKTITKISIRAWNQQMYVPDACAVTAMFWTCLRVHFCTARTLKLLKLNSRVNYDIRQWLWLPITQTHPQIRTKCHGSDSSQKIAKVSSHINGCFSLARGLPSSELKWQCSQQFLP